MSNIFSISTLKNKGLESTYNKNMEELNQFFQMNWVVSVPKIYVIDNRETINFLKDYETPKWLVGWSMDRNVYILDKDAFATDSDHNYFESDYNMLIKKFFKKKKFFFGGADYAFL